MDLTKEASPPEHCGSAVWADNLFEVWAFDVGVVVDPECATVIVDGLEVDRGGGDEGERV